MDDISEDSIDLNWIEIDTNGKWISYHTKDLGPDKNGSTLFINEEKFNEQLKYINEFNKINSLEEEENKYILDGK